MAGIRGEVNVVSDNIPRRFGERKRGTSSEDWLHKKRWCMERHGHVDLQHVALVDPHRKNTTVRSLHAYPTVCLSPSHICMCVWLRVLYGIQMGLHTGGESAVQGYEPSDCVLQRADHMGQMGQYQCWSHQNQSLLPRHFPHPLRVSYILFWWFGVPFLKVLF